MKCVLFKAKCIKMRGKGKRNKEEMHPAFRTPHRALYETKKETEKLMITITKKKDRQTDRQVAESI